ncbi:hypothetical protein EVAR_48783_1 [Eumeta japonica]|uniref:Uncharacterized protein n=1 Tax=Eumeta variegata TaxID=151549 RepID=A0A4C1Y5R9_EUMVA|nr:hypothetical protein EVAR_48783_1 [Eumeta japonica]
MCLFPYQVPRSPAGSWRRLADAAEKQTYELPESSRWSSPLMGTCKSRGVASALPPSWVGIEYVTERGNG